MRGDEADHVALDAPGEDRAAVGEVVAGRADRGRGDESVAAHVADLAAAEPVAELGDPVVGAAGEGDVVEASWLALGPAPPARAAGSPRSRPRRRAEAHRGRSDSAAARKPTVP